MTTVPFLAWVRYPGSDYATPVRDPEMLDKFLETGYRLVERPDSIGVDHRGGVRVDDEVNFGDDPDPGEIVRVLMAKVLGTTNEKLAEFVTNRLFHELLRSGLLIFGVDEATGVGIPHGAVYQYAGFAHWDPRDWPEGVLTCWDGERIRQLEPVDPDDPATLWREVDHPAKAPPRPDEICECGHNWADHTGEGFDGVLCEAMDELRPCACDDLRPIDPPERMAS